MGCNGAAKSGVLVMVDRSSPPADPERYVARKARHMKNPIAPIAFAVVFAVVAGLGTFWMQMSGGYIAAACAVGALGGAVCGYLLADRKQES